MSRSTPSPIEAGTASLAGRHVAIVGKLAGMSRRAAEARLLDAGALLLPEEDARSADLIVIGERDWLDSADGKLNLWLESADAEPAAEVLRETELWRRLGLVDAEQNVHCLYTPGMLADLLGVGVAVVRRWQRRGLIVPVRTVERLPYFDFQEVTTARRLAQMVAGGMSPADIKRQLARLGRWLPGVERPLAQLAVLVEGKSLLLRQGDGLIEPGGQLRFDFPALDVESERGPHLEPTLSFASARGIRADSAGLEQSPEALSQLATELEDAGRLADAVEAYRTWLFVGGANAEASFRLAEVLYRLGDLPAARERYYITLELDEHWVEARANLGCLLAEEGQLELAVAAFRGALAQHPDYPDVHYHLARVLAELGRCEEAQPHWETFFRLAAGSPWAEEARHWLEQSAMSAAPPDEYP